MFGRVYIVVGYSGWSVNNLYGLFNRVCGVFLVCKKIFVLGSDADIMFTIKYLRVARTNCVKILVLFVCNV